MQPVKSVAERVDDLEKRIDIETFDRKEALLRQEHRVLAAVSNIYVHRTDPALRQAAIVGLIGAVVGRTAMTAVVGGSLIAVACTAFLALQANYLLTIQNEKMDVQTIVMDAQRRTQNFQAEFAAISVEVAAQSTERLKASEEAEKELRATALRCASIMWPNRVFVSQMLKDVDDRYSQGVDSSINALKDSDTQLSELLAILGHLESIARATQGIRTLARLEACTNSQYDSRRRGKWILDDGINWIEVRLDASLISRIAGLTSALRPFPVLEESYDNDRRGSLPLVGRLIEQLFEPAPRHLEPEARLVRQSVSTEKGQLITFLLRHRVSLRVLSRAGADLGSSDLSNRSFTEAVLSNMPRSSFKSSRLTAVVLEGDFRGADFSCAHLADVKTSGALFSGAKFDDSRLKDVRLPLRAFLDADFSRANFEDVQVDMDGKFMNGLESRPLIDVLQQAFPKMETSFPMTSLRVRRLKEYESFLKEGTLIVDNAVQAERQDDACEAALWRVAPASR